MAVLLFLPFPSVARAWQRPASGWRHVAHRSSNGRLPLVPLHGCRTRTGESPDE